jgi:hypothetical protein
MDLQQLKALDSLLYQNDYSDEVFDRLLPGVNGYLQAAKQLRALPLGEVRPVTVLYARERDEQR